MKPNIIKLTLIVIYLVTSVKTEWCLNDKIHENYKGGDIKQERLAYIYLKFKINLGSN